MSPSAIVIEQSPIQHTLDPDSKLTLGNLSPGRLSPNLFLGINIDPNSMDRTFEWTSYTSPSTSSSTNHQQFQQRLINNDPNCLNMDDTTPYDDIKFLNVDQFNMETFKGDDYILNIDPNILGDDQQKQNNLIGLDLHNFPFDDDDDHGDIGIDKSSPLMDLERPLINITVQNVDDEKC